MVEVTQADRNAAKNMDRQNLLGCYLEEHIDRGDYDHVPAIQQFATHRIEAAKAERDRIVAWLREMGSIRGGVADAIEAGEHLEESKP